MLKELNVKDILYDLDFSDVNIDRSLKTIPKYESIYEKIQTSLEIDKSGYNLYIVDDFSNDKVENIKEFIQNKLSYKPSPKDICYVTNEDQKYPYSIKLDSGMGKVLSKTLEKIQDNYSEHIYEFYNNLSNNKETIIENLQKERNELIDDLLKLSKKEGFSIKSSDNGFVFMPIKEDKILSEDDYDNLGVEEKEAILSKVTELKKEAQNVLEKLKDIEKEGVEKIKVLLEEYLLENMKEDKEDFRREFENSMEALEFLNSVCRNIEEELIENYTINYEEDLEEIAKIIYKYKVNVLVDNSENKNPLVIFEDDPSMANLVGSIEYENKNGVYVTDINLIKAGSMIKANEGCLILRVNSLFSNPLAYYYLKKSLLNGKVDFDYNKGYLEVLALSGLKPEPIPINTKVILIGDYETYNLLYSYDEDFKKIFKLKGEYNPVINMTPSCKSELFYNIKSICNSKKLSNISEGGILEVAKYLSRKAENRNKIYFNDFELNNILVEADRLVKKQKDSNTIQREDIEKVIYKDEIIEKEVLDEYKNNTIFMSIEGTKVGQINGLSVIDLGYHRFGRPIRITCCCYKGHGNIIDIQKESNLSGSIHDKAINILKGYINNLVGAYDNLPVDFHISFEQIYGKVDGDSASVAEIISIISALSKIGIKQNIAVTGSINQFGEVQPIGGVNEKIEGFFNVCKSLGGYKGKGVLIPKSNKDNLVLNEEVERAILKGEFHIYTMEDVKDAAEILLGKDYTKFQVIMLNIDKETKKYNRKFRGRNR
ncbi:AAA family ATPase [Clostridium oceanicum]|uniref:endopeptidase La n=1 Tax=Clostridium oceanicum TaxID=1543 RepID=A0ABP3UP84_9CLOT